MTLNAVLERIELSTPQVANVADFYRRALRLDVDATVQGELRCSGPGRALWLRTGAANQLHASQFRFTSRSTLLAYAQRFRDRDFAHFDERSAEGPLLLVTDPEGRQVRFRHGAEPESTTHAPGAARLQHYAVRTPDPEALVGFYAKQLGFVVSDLVRDEKGVLRAAFLRTDEEHHALAIFRAPTVRFDHFSCETGDWQALRDWADHMAQQGLALVWGIGRHGPGNDTFFMVADPDGNLAEISSDLERCADDREAGVWPHHPSTLNQWGMAIMRS